jgi:hypothetical protein
MPEANLVLEWLGIRKQTSDAKARRKNEFFSPLPARGKSIGSLRPPFLTSRTPMRSIGHDREATAGERLSAMLSEAVRASALKICPSGLSLAKTPPHPSFSPRAGRRRARAARDELACRPHPAAHDEERSPDNSLPGRFALDCVQGH